MLTSEFPTLPAPKRGKVRDVYDLGDSILFVATDRISAYDCIMPDPIPGKGEILTQMSLNWFRVLGDIPNHLITADVAKYPEALTPYREELRGRSMIVRKLKMLPVECIVRGYLVGSGWASYKKDGTVCGQKLREGYGLADKLDEPIFTPTTKAEEGHDEAITTAELAEIIGADITARLERLAIDIYKRAANYALERGIIIADTKFEFGLDENGTIILADEVLTPDSSRFWPVKEYEVAHCAAPEKRKNPPSLDKQYLRDWLDSISFNRQPPIPSLPAEVIAATTEKYNEALNALK